ncbi:MAG TPA: hypothetical protein DIU35_15945 [Candidatus Latescibacteria bacterium]|nr:hypothetical protein [Candidatus Latescibacterota bacterium]|tara:strand:+ start:1255 stop:2106 length:852 start_codon:yes stop_codon:yes gene_type:complete
MLQNSVISQGQVVLSLNYEYEFLAETQFGMDPIPNINKEQTWLNSGSLFASYGVTEGLSIAAVVPFRNITNDKYLFPGQHEDQYEGGKYTRHSAGMGDIVLLVNFVPNILLKLPGTVITVGIKLATGSVHAVDQYGTRFSDLLQLGTGSYDPVFSISSTQSWNNLSVTGSFFTRFTMQENPYGYKYGDEFQTVLGTDYQHSSRFFGGVSLNHVFTTRDTFGYGKVARKRGGKWFYMAPRFGFNLKDNLSLEARIPIPLYQNVNESQLVSDYQIQFGTSYHFDL